MMGSGPTNPLEMRVEAFLDVSSVANRLPLNASVRSVLARFGEGHGAVIVVDDQDRPAGVFTSSDMAKIRRAFEQNPDGPASEVMSEPVFTVATSQSIQSALKTTQERGFITGIAVIDQATSKYAGYLYRSPVAKILSNVPVD